MHAVTQRPTILPRAPSLVVLVNVEGRVLNLAKYRATSVTTSAFWGSQDESHIPGFEAF